VETLIGSGIQAGSYLLVTLIGVGVMWGLLHGRVKALERKTDTFDRHLEAGQEVRDRLTRIETIQFLIAQKLGIDLP
jgi:hypothetical protein